MKRICMVVVLIALCLTLGAVKSSALTFNDGFSTYVTGPSLGMYQGNQQWPLTIDGGAAQGLLLYDPVWKSFKVLGFENDTFWGWSIEGHWSGGGSAAYGVLNDGTHFNTNIFLGPVLRSWAGEGLYRK